MAVAQPHSPSRFMELLTTPWVDKTIAVIAVTPSIIELYHRFTSAHLTFVRGVVGIQTMIMIVIMLLRRTPVRVTPNPFYWLLAFVATYGVLAFVAFSPVGTPLAPSWVANTLAIISVSIMIYARLSVGFSIGFVPADRGIVTRGAYRFAAPWPTAGHRHPTAAAEYGIALHQMRSYASGHLRTGMSG